MDIVELHQTTTIQLWLGTTYGSVLVLNCNCQLMSSPGGADGSQTLPPFLKTMSISPSSSQGTQHTLKGAIVNISFLDTNLNPIHSTAPASGPPKTASSAAAAGSSVGVSSEDVEDDFLNLESEFNYQTSNSIADNFGSSTGAAAEPGLSNSSPSPSSTPNINSTFVNPFANTPPPPTPSSSSMETETKAAGKSTKSNSFKIEI